MRPDPLPPLPAALEVAVYRITAEALDNAVRHSRADRAQDTVTVADGTVSVRVADDGDGFAAHRHGPGVGLRFMAERAEELGGRFTLSSTAEGTVVHATLPAVPGTTMGQEPHAPGAGARPDS
ncbi:ATP-binding protein [Streptomyces sp. NPDC093546]|uniref:ATP-binding protein n=1 Tax=Streptomyces sp. NPDC093546 TaxID=3366040 RepID=UPI00381BA0A4